VPDVDEALLLGGIRSSPGSCRKRTWIGAWRPRRGPELAHDRELVAVELASKVAADGFPRVAAIVAAEKAVGGEVEPGILVWADDEGRHPSSSAAARHPLPACGWIIVLCARCGRSKRDSTPYCRGRVHGVGILRVDAAVEAVPAQSHEPVGVGDAWTLRVRDGPAQGEVVLRAAVDVVERTAFITATS